MSQPSSQQLERLGDDDHPVEGADHPRRGHEHAHHRNGHPHGMVERSILRSRRGLKAVSLSLGLGSA